MKILKTLLVGAALLCFAAQAYAQRFVTIANDINALTNANMGNIQTNYFVPELGAGTGGLFTFDRNSTATPDGFGVYAPAVGTGRIIRTPLELVGRLTISNNVPIRWQALDGTIHNVIALDTSNTLLLQPLTGEVVGITGTATGVVFNAGTGFQYQGGAALGNYLRGNGTHFVASTIQTGDIPSSAITGIVQLAQGGTAKDLSAGATGGLVWKDADSFEVTAALTGVLQGNGVSAPSSISGLSANLIPKYDADGPQYFVNGSLTDDSTGISSTNWQLSLAGSGTAIRQVRLGTSSIRGVIASRHGSGTLVLGSNAEYPNFNTDLWSQPTAGQGSMMFEVLTIGGQSNNKFTWRRAPPGQAQAAYATFWTEVMALNYDKNLGLGTSIWGTSAATVFAIANGTAPSTFPADMVQMGSKDRGGVAGKSALHLYTEDGTSHVFGDLVGIGTVIPDTKFQVSSTANPMANLSTVGNYSTLLLNTSGVLGEASGLAFGVSSGSTVGASIYHVRSGSSSAGDLAFATRVLSGSVTERMRITSDGAIMIANGTAPSSSPPDIFQLWSQDVGGVAGNAGAHIRTESGATHAFGPGLSVGSTVNTGSGIVNANSGFRIGNAAGNQQYLRGNGTDFVSSGLVASDLSGVVALANGGTAFAGPYTDMGVIFYHGGNARLQDDSTNFVYNTTNNQLRVWNTQAAVGSDFSGVLIGNPTDAASGLQQFSPTLTFEARGWKTAATAASQIARYRQYVGAVQGLNNPTAYWTTGYDINTVGYVEQLHLDSTGFLRFTKDALGATTTTGELGLRLQNDTPATVGLNQHSPVILLRGHGWKTDAVAASRPVDFRMHVVPVTGGVNPTAMLRIDSEINDAGSFGNPVTISSVGSMSVGAQYEPPFGVINAQVGYKIGTGATAGTYLRGDGVNFIQGVIAAGDLPAGTGGDVDGPGSSTDNAVARFDGTTGKLIQNSGVIISDANVVTIPSLTAGRVLFAGTGGIVTDDDGLLYNTATNHFWVNNGSLSVYNPNAGATSLRVYSVGGPDSGNTEYLLLNHTGAGAQVYSQATGTGTTEPLNLLGGSGGNTTLIQLASKVSLGAGDTVGLGGNAITVAHVSAAYTGALHAFGIQTEAGVDDVIDDFLQVEGATTDGSATTIATVPITASKTYLIVASVRARRTGGVAGTADDGAVYVRHFMVTTKAGTVTVNSTGASDTVIEDQAGWNVTGAGSGANFILQATGAADNNVIWHGTITISPVGV